MKLRERTDANKAVITVRNGSRSRLLSIAAAGGTSLTVVITVYTRHDVRDTSLSRFSAHVGSTRSGTRASCCRREHRREHRRERTVLNRASIFVNFVNHFPLQIAPYFTALTVFTVTQGEAEMPPSPAHELCKLIRQQQLDKACLCRLL